MGQYWMPVNIDKREFVNPHKLGTGLKLWEQLVNHPGTGAALIVLQAAMPDARGGGDLVSHPVIGRWAGDRVVLVGGYAEPDDIPSSPIPADMLYACCHDREDWNRTLEHWMKHCPDIFDRAMNLNLQPFTDITDQVCEVLEKELDGKFEGDGWRSFKPNAHASTANG
jgi:hypothetical protein